MLDDRLREAAAEVRSQVEAAPIPALPERSESTHPLRRRVLVFAAAAVLVLVAIGSVAWFVRLDEVEPAVPPPVTVVPTTATPDDVLPPESQTTQAPQVTVTTAGPVTTPVPPAQPAIVWERIEDLPALEGAVLSDVISVNGAFYASGTRTNPDDPFRFGSQIFTSADGRIWESVDTATLTGDIESAQRIKALAANEVGSIVAVGGEANDAAVWSTIAAAAWTQFDPGRMAVDGWELLEAVAVGPNGWVAVGAGDRDALVWWSATGGEWEPATDPDLLGSHDTGEAAMYDVVSGGPGYVAVGQVGFVGSLDPDTGSKGTVWVSEDGRDWERIQSEVVEDDTVLEGITVSPDGTRILAFGRQGIYASNDGRTWEYVLDPRSGGPPPGSKALWTKGWLLAAGPDLTVAMWASADGGTTWASLVDSDPAFDPDLYLWINGLAGSDTAIVAVGGYAPPGIERGAIWVGSWTE